LNFKPVIFLAFANDKVDNTAYLRNLSLEQRGIRNALAEAVSKGLCEVIERSSTTISDILDVFQDPIYGPRVSIFHYGGHADGFSLLLESEDGTKALTHKEGLIPFFARQENLKLIFLNGCSSEGQATDLLKAGIPAVIGTTASINDEIATALATRFYSSLGDGSSIEKAWADATDEVKIKNGTGNTRALYWQGKQEVSDRFPWVIQFKPGAEIIKEWNLPDISGNPLYGLPDIPQSYNLPESPFLYLNRYERKHAEVFFGRSYYVRSLFSSVADRQGPPIILLCGQSGTGKSSLLEAGLQPRLESRYEIIYLRRNGIIGLSATLFNALLEKCGFKPDVSVIKETRSYSELDNLKQFVANLSDTIKSELQPIIEKLSSSNKSDTSVTPVQDQKPSSLSDAWNLLERKLAKSVLVILDQLEEAYTRPNASLGNEMNQLFLDLKTVFGNPATLPKGKILLSYRKEYQPEIEEYCKKYELSRSKVFIEHISKNDIVELFQGFMTSQRLMSRYNLTVENGLPELIAEDLAADKEAPIAPVLQILLTKMWKKAVELHPGAPVFTHDLYHQLKEEGLAMDEFLQNQLQGIKKKLPEEHDLGFVLDVLAFHCTANNTSAARTEKELQDHYPFNIDAAKKVLAACKDYFLITDLGGNEHSSMLAHDTLAKSVVKAQLRSTQPIQQGKRILASRIEAIKAGSEFATMDSWELKLIEKIQTYLPAFDEGEKKLFDSSRKEITKQEKQRQRIVNSSRIIIALSILSGIVAWYLYAQSKKHEKASFVSLMTVSSGMNIIKDPSLAINQALRGLEKDSTSIELKKMLLTAYYHSNKFKLAWYKNIYQSNDQFTDLKYNQRTGMMIPFFESDTLVILDSLGKIHGRLIAGNDSIHSKENQNSFTDIRWSNDGQAIVALDLKGNLFFFDNKGDLLSKINLCSSFDYNDSVNAVVYSRGDKVYLLDILGNQMDSVSFPPNASDIGQIELTDIKFTGDGNHILVTKKINDSTDIYGTGIFLMDLKKKINIRKWPYGGQYFTSNSGNLFAMGDSFINEQGANNYVFWNTHGELLTNITENSNKEIVFQPLGNKVLIYGRNNVQLYDIASHTDYKVFNHDKEVTITKFSPMGNYVLTGSADNTGRISNLDATVHFILQGHIQSITALDMENNQTNAWTASLDGTVKKWILPDFNHVNFRKNNGYMDQIMADPTGSFLLIPGATTGQNDILDMRINKAIPWKTPMYQHNKYLQWYFVDSTHIIGRSLHQLHLYIRDKDSLINLSKTKLHSSFESNMQSNAEDEILYHDVGVLNHKIVSISDDSLRYWSLNGVFQKSIPLTNIGKNVLSASCYSPDQSILAIAILADSSNKYINVFDENGNMTKYPARINYQSMIRFSHSSDRMVVLSPEGSMEIIFIDHRPSAFTQRNDCNPYQGGCSIIEFHFSRDDAQMISSSSDGLIRIFDSTGNEVKNFQSDITPKDADFTPDGKLIYAYDADTTLKLWDLRGNLIYTYNGCNPFFTKDDNRLYTIKNPRSEINKTGIGTELRDYLTPQGAYNYFKSSKTFQKSSDNNSYGKYWHKLLEWLKLE
jgi:WD40 repeat protein